MYWLHNLGEWVLNLANTPAAPVSLFGLAAAESIFFPLPPDLLLLALAVINPEKSLLYAAICTAGSTIGGMIGFAIGRLGGRPVLNRWVSKEKIAAIEDYFQRYDVLAVFIAGFTPIPYKVFTIASGTFRLRFWRFVIASVCSRGLRFFLVGLCVMLFGDQAKTYLKEYFNIITIGFVVLLIGGFLVVRWAFRGYVPDERANP